MNTDDIEKNGLLELAAWTNQNNARFYENISIQEVKTLSIEGGLEDGCDLDLIKDYIDNAPSILEVGAGYGRVLNYLFKHNYPGKITAIERSKKFCKYLHNEFANKVQLYEADLLDFDINDKFDLILWMWTGIADFGEEEQCCILERLKEYLQPSSTMIVDTIPTSIKPFHTIQAEENYHILKRLNIPHYGYFPTSEQVHNYGSLLQFKKIISQEYQSTTNRKRLLYFLFN